MALEDIWFREGVVRIMRAVSRAHRTLTTGERDIFEALCEGFGIEPSEVLPSVQVIEQLPAASEGDGVDGRH